MVTSLRHELAGAFGDPIDENPTGVMMEPAFAAAGLNWRYQLLHVGAADLPAAVAGARALGFRGFNLTIPHKVAVLEHLDAPFAGTTGPGGCWGDRPGGSWRRGGGMMGPGGFQGFPGTDES